MAKRWALFCAMAWASGEKPFSINVLININIKYNGVYQHGENITRNNRETDTLSKISINGGGNARELHGGAVASGMPMKSIEGTSGAEGYLYIVLRSFVK